MKTRMIRLIYLITISNILFVEAMRHGGDNADTEASKICNETYFREKFMSNKRGIIDSQSFTLDSLNKTCFKEYHSTCKGNTNGTLYTMIEGENRTFFKLLVRTALYDDLSGANAGCWGIAMEYITDKENRMSFENFDQTGVVMWDLKYTLKTRYVIKVALLPTGKQFTFTWTSPGRCQLEIIDDIYRLLLKEKKVHECNLLLNLIKRQEFAEEVCKKYENRVHERRDLIKKYLEIQNCKLKISPPIDYVEPKIQNSKSSKVSNVVILTAVSSVLLLLFFVYVSRWIWKKKIKDGSRMKYPEHAESFSILDDDDQIWDYNLNQSQYTPSVMILNRPGCKLLEIFLRDFAFILKSYNIDVKLALLEQNEIDADGGIASYMQRHINTCDYIIIMLTEDNKETESSGILKHRPYEFALKVIGGLAYHQNDCSRYVPVYLTSYNKVVNVMPSFLNASTTFGNRLPNDIHRLIRRILNSRSTLKVSKERQLKDQFFINRMKQHSKKFLEKQHPDCLKENCSKGMAYASVVNLSSIWPSTIHSKWQSTDLDFEDYPDMQLMSDNLDNSSLLQNKFDTMLNGHTSYNDRSVCTTDNQNIINVDPDAMRNCISDDKMMVG